MLFQDIALFSPIIVLRPEELTNRQRDDIYITSAPLCVRRIGAKNEQGDNRIPLWQASPDLYRQPQQPDSGYHL